MDGKLIDAANILSSIFDLKYEGILGLNKKWKIKGLDVDWTRKDSYLKLQNDLFDKICSKIVFLMKNDIYRPNDSNFIYGIKDGKNKNCQNEDIRLFQQVMILRLKLFFYATSIMNVFGENNNVYQKLYEKYNLNNTSLTQAYQQWIQSMDDLINLLVEPITFELLEDTKEKYESQVAKFETTDQDVTKTLCTELANACSDSKGQEMCGKAATRFAVSNKETNICPGPLGKASEYASEGISKIKSVQAPELKIKEKWQSLKDKLPTLSNVVSKIKSIIPQKQQKIIYYNLSDLDNKDVQEMNTVVNKSWVPKLQDILGNSMQLKLIETQTRLLPQQKTEEEFRNLYKQLYGPLLEILQNVNQDIDEINRQPVKMQLKAINVDNLEMYKQKADQIIEEKLKQELLE